VNVLFTAVVSTTLAVPTTIASFDHGFTFALFDRYPKLFLLIVVLFTPHGGPSFACGGVDARAGGGIFAFFFGLVVVLADGTFALGCFGVQWDVE
jgi:hypothetical protein